MRFRLIISVIISALLVASPPAQANKGAIEYFTSNPRGRLLIRVQVWGSVNLPGIHHVPDDTSLIQLLGYAGGPKGNIEDGQVSLRRITEKDSQSFEFSGDDILESSKPAEFILQPNDVVFVEAGDKQSKFMQRLSIVSTISALVTSLVVTFFLVESKRNENSDSG